MMIELLLVLAIETATSPAVMPTQCDPDEVCQPIDPQDPKPVIPANCVLDQEGGLVCNPIDQQKGKS